MENAAMNQRYNYINERNKKVYDRVNLFMPKGRRQRIIALTVEVGISLNEYINLLINLDIDSNGKSRILNKKEEFTEEQRQMLLKWQIPQKYFDMIEGISTDKKEGYTIYLKPGYINDETGSRVLKSLKTHDIRMMINKSHRV